MSNTIQLKRRTAGATGAPSSLRSGEVAFNEMDDILYYGKGDNGSGGATSILTIAGAGAVLMLSGAQTVAGVKTFSSFPVTPASAPTTNYQVANKKYVDDSVGGGGGGDMVKATYDPGNINDDAFDQDNMQNGTTNKNFTATNQTKLAGIETGADVTDATNVAAAGAFMKTTEDADDINDGSTKVIMLAAERTKLTGIASGATANSSDATLLARANHTGTQAQSTVVNLVTDLAAKAPIASPTFTGDVTLAQDPSSALHAVTKQYVDALALNVGQRTTVRAATVGNITISTALNSGDALDGVTLANGDLVLVKDQSTGGQNGIYVVGAVPARAPQYDTWAEYPGSTITVQEGTVGADTIWLCTANSGGTLNTTRDVLAGNSDAA